MKVLYITYDGILEPLGQSQVLGYIEELAKNNKIYLLSYEKKQDLKDKESLNSLSKRLKNNNITWYRHRYHKTPSALSTLYDISIGVIKSSYIILRHKVDALHTRSYVPTMIAYIIKKIYDKRFIFDMRGFWADERVDVGLWDLKNKIYKGVYSFFKMKEKAFLENADHIVSLTLAGKKEMDSWKHIEKLSLPISIIPCCADTALFDRRKIKLEAMQNARQELGIRADEPILTYIGSITWYLIDEMFRFFIIYLEKYPEGKFLFITHASADFIRSRAKAAGVSMDKILIVSAQRSSVPALAILGHFSIIFRKPAYSTKAACPTKQGELMSLGIPIICNSNVGDMDMIVRQYGSGIIVDSSNDSDYRKTVDNMKKIMFDPDKIREGAIDYFSLQLAVSKYKSIYSSLLN